MKTSNLFSMGGGIRFSPTMACVPHVKPESAEGVESLANDEIRELMMIIRSLRHLGIEAQDLPFPKLCVTGDQSTGKSSLIEGISEIKVPRGSGTCTRCPVEINLSDDPAPGAKWRCEVYLSQKYTFDPHGHSKATRRKPLGPWIEQELFAVHFATLTRKKDVGPALEWAQLATLNPSSNPEFYKPGANSNTAKTFQEPFSPNVVRLDIVGPGLLNLSFYDLPGVISIGQDFDDRVPHLITNLVKDYISAENCIILHTLTMNNDAVNSRAARVIQESRADNRTVGVLTKPDLFANDSIDQWRDILNGKSLRRKLGYFVVKNNPKAEVDHSMARREEKAFFETQPPFCTELSTHAHRFGTHHLQRALSIMLAQQIKASLPKIISEIGNKLSTTREHIAQMPQPPEDNVSNKISAELQRLAKIIEMELEGGTLDCETFFFTKWNMLVRKFGEMLVCSRPLITRPDELTPPSLPVVGFEDSPTPSRPNGNTDAMIISDDENEPISKRHKLTTTPQTGQKRTSREFIPSTPQKVTLNVRMRRKKAFSDAQEFCKRFTIDEIRDKLRKVDIGAGVSSHPKVAEKMYQEAISHWSKLIDQFIAQMHTECQNHLAHWIKSTLGCWSKTRLYDEVTLATRRFLESAFKEQRQALFAMLDMEKLKLLIIDVEEDSFNEREIFTDLQRSSVEWRTQYRIECNLSQGRVMKDTEKESLLEFLRKQPDPYVEELHILAKVRSHYHTAATQFARYAGLSMCTNLFRAMRENLPREIGSAIGLDGQDADDNCKKLLAVDPEAEKERQRLLRDETALEKGHAQLSALVSVSNIGGLGDRSSCLPFRDGSEDLYRGPGDTA